MRNQRISWGTLKSPSGACSLTQSGKYSPSLDFSVLDVFLGSWVIDSRAIDHMTHSPQKFSIFSPYPNNKKIATVDGFLATMANQGEVRLNKSMFWKMCYM